MFLAARAALLSMPGVRVSEDLSSLCRFRDDAGWGLAVDAVKLIFTSGVAAHSYSLFTSAFHRASVDVSERARRAVARPGRPPRAKPIVRLCCFLFLFLFFLCHLLCDYSLFLFKSLRWRVL